MQEKGMNLTGKLIEPLNRAVVENGLNAVQIRAAIQGRIQEITKKDHSVDEPGWCITDCIVAAPPYCNEPL